MIVQNTLAFPSGRSVGNCRKDAKRLASEMAIPLHEALSLISGRNGGPPDWARAMAALRSASQLPQEPCSPPSPAGVSREAIEAVLAGHPLLSTHGIGMVRAFMPRGSSYTKLLAEARIELLNSSDQISRCLAYLEHAEPTKTISSAAHSYRLKHQVEFFSRALLDKPAAAYVSNGAFICAAIMKGFKYRANALNPPNVLLNISARSPVFIWSRLSQRDASQLSARDKERLFVLCDRMGLSLPSGFGSSRRARYLGASLEAPH